MEVYAWLMDLIPRQKNCPTGMISGWVQKVTEVSFDSWYEIVNGFCLFQLLSFCEHALKVMTSFFTGKNLSGNILAWDALDSQS